MLPQEQIGGIIPKIQRISEFMQDIKTSLKEAEEEMEKSLLYHQIEGYKKLIKEMELEDQQLREQGKQIMLDNGLKKFEMLDGTTIQLNSTPGALVIAEGVQLDKKYYKTKVQVTMDKVQVKKDFMEGLILDPGVTIESEYKFIIKSK
ncbi:hypothetical protein KBD33_05970 [Candidatus Gracilibacteria bacterium]|nr:hypothetical protein [Candidatus Gracilibacteria bacterium]